MASSKRRALTRAQVAAAIVKRNGEQVARRDGHHVATTFTVGAEHVTVKHYVGEELEAEAYREGVVALGKFVDAPVTMSAQFHDHGTGVVGCDCHVRHKPTMWRNALARTGWAAEQLSRLLDT